MYFVYRSESNSESSPRIRFENYCTIQWAFLKWNKELDQSDCPNHLYMNDVFQLPKTGCVQQLYHNPQHGRCWATERLLWIYDTRDATQFRHLHLNNIHVNETITQNDWYDTN